LERWNNGKLPTGNWQLPIAIGGIIGENVEALAEIPLWREKNGMLEE